MRRLAVIPLAAGVLSLAACGGAKTPAPDSAAGEPSVPSLSVDSAKADSVRADSVRADSVRADSVRADSVKADSLKKAGAKVETGDYDRALRPRYTIDEKTGKLVPIKKP